MTPARRRLAYGAIAAGFAALGGWAAWRRLEPVDTGAAAVDLVYAQTLTSASGEAVDLGALRGQTVVLNFWATWCPPCVDEMPELAELHREISTRKATVIGIGIDSPSKIREFAEKHQFPYPLLIGGMNGSELAKQLGNASGALPFTVVIDAKGRVIDRKLGRIKLTALRSKVLSVLDGRTG